MLLVDVGNSCLKYATVDKGILNQQQRLCYNTNNLAKILSKVWSDSSIPDSVWISNVAGKKVAKLLKKWIKSHWTLKAIFVKTPAYACGINNAYEQPKRLGVDRWLAVIGARNLKAGTLCIVDCGTAVTVDVLSAENDYCGGVIVAGIDSMQRALLKETDALARYHKNEKKFKFQLLAKNTHTGITLGSHYAIVGLIEYMMNSLEKQGQRAQLILTGGSASALLPLLKKPYLYVPDLVLQGLFIMAIQ